MDDPEGVTRYLGCEHHFSQQVCPLTGATVRTIEWDMGSFMESCVKNYETLSGWPCTRKVATPFILVEDEQLPVMGFYSAVASPLGILPHR